MISIDKNINIVGRHQKPILIDVFYNETRTPKPVIVFCHGYKGFKDWGAWDLVARMFANAGFFFIKFNFSHNGGTAEQPIDFPDLEAFGQNNFIKELDDLETVINWITAPGFNFKKEVKSKDIILIGHSRGGGIATIKAAEDSRVSKLITWASVSDYESRFPKGEALEEWQSNGVMYVQNGRTKQQMPHYFQFYTTFITHKERLTITNAAQQIQIPYLIIHGTADPTVSVQEGKDIHSCNANSELFLIEGADHVFGAKHPWERNDLPKNLKIIAKKSIDFANF
ncbi:S9 family peptidase [Aquimarina sp. AU119]|uniref:alpha/beta hydrolase family protein n=1 Tax=Aquimarina sp. AU119 TaxID=2108528 RepID=UPI000D690231|nr:alpha/beta hydrolase [Aquimarina sp. AU119]